MIFLYVENEGWKEFELSNTDELQKRGISIGSRAYIGSGAHIGYGASIGSGAHIGSNTKPLIIRITGSAHQLSYWGQDRIDIGCQSQTIQNWIDNFESIGKDNDYTDVQIAEYKKYIDFIASVHK